MDDDFHTIKIFASDDNLKSLGELLSNETGRKIMIILMKNQMYTNEIATKLDIRVSLVIHHLKKLEELDLLVIEDKKIKRKGEKHRFFKICSDIFITLDKSKEDIEKKETLKKIFKDIVKIVCVSLIVFSSWLYNVPKKISNTNTLDFHEILSYPVYNESLFWPLVIIITLILGLRIMCSFRKKEKKRSLKI